MDVKANTSPNHAIKILVPAPAVAAAMAMQISTATRKKSLAGKMGQRSDRETTGYQRFMI